MKERQKKTKRMVLTGMLFAVAIVLSIVESMLPSPVPVPGVKFGLSNIVVMYALFFLRKQEAFLIAILKGVFAAMTRGVVAGLLSVAGGISSIIVMLLLKKIFKESGSLFLYSMFGALAHNLGQFVVISIIYTSIGILYYLPVLIVSGIVAGMITAVLLNVIMPALKRLEIGE